MGILDLQLNYLSHFLKKIHEEWTAATLEGKKECTTHVFIKQQCYRALNIVIYKFAWNYQYIGPV